METALINKTFLAAVALVSVVAATRASAEPFEFRYKSHELETQGGRADLMVRLDRMVERWCADTGARGLSRRSVADKCREETKASIVAQIDPVALASLRE